MLINEPVIVFAILTLMSQLVHERCEIECDIRTRININTDCDLLFYH